MMVVVFLHFVFYKLEAAAPATPFCPFCRLGGRRGPLTVPSLNHNGCKMYIGATGLLGLVVFCLVRVPLDAVHSKVVVGWA